jgi:tetratricopeptide (TPR) repeat protein
MKRFQFPSGLVEWLAILGSLCVATRVVAEPFVPKDDEQVLERLPGGCADRVGRELRELRAQANADRENLNLATALARRCIERSRMEGDPRYLGYAQAALAPWWKEPNPPLEALVLRATIKQSQHDFAGALEDLDRAVLVQPDSGQAWLTRATVLTVTGKYQEARRSCVPLVRLAPQLVATTAAANVSSLTGGGARACELLHQALGREPGASTSEKLWAWTVLAEASARLGESEQAEAAFAKALGLEQHDPYLLGAYADFLLDQGRGSEVLPLLQNETRIDALLLRVALAEAQVTPSPGSLRVHVRMLEDRFEASRRRGDGVHGREEARFMLQLLGQPRRALDLARANWQVQREPADARILLESALAAHDPAAAVPAIQFISTNRFEDVRLAGLVHKCALHP